MHFEILHDRAVDRMVKWKVAARWMLAESVPPYLPLLLPDAQALL